jgi:ribosome-binding factor A
MTSRRVLKAAEAIREVVSMTILTELRDPRVSDVTVTSVEVSPDMRQAKVNVSVMGDEAKQKLALHGLQNASGFLQAKIARRIDTRYTPRLRFVLDQGVKRSIELSRILDEVLPRPAAPETEEEDEEETPDAVPETTDATDAVDDLQDIADPSDQDTPDHR